MRHRITLLLPVFLSLPLAVSAAVQTLPAGNDALLAPVALLPESPTADDPYRAALEHLVKGNLDAAEAGFRAQLQANPKSARALLGLAEVAFRRKRMQDGESFLLQALKIDPENAYVQSSLGRYYAATGKPEPAERHLKEALRLAPGRDPVRMDLADFYNTRLNRPQDALPLYDKVIASQPGHAGAHYARGIAWWKQGNRAQAKVDLEASSRLDPENPLPVEALARLQAEEGKHDEALRTLDRILVKTPQLARPRVLRSEILAARGDVDGAIRELETLVRNTPGNLEFRLRLAMALHARGRLDDALGHYRRATEIDPRSAVAFNNAAAIQLQRRTAPELAEKWAQRAVELTPGNADYRETLGQALLARGRTDDALRQFARVRELAPQDAGLLAGIGLALADRGLHRPARDYLSAALGSTQPFAGADRARRTLEKLPQ